MDSITIQNYRCFGEEQTARLAPLTLLVGPNSAGKTSFLALIRALWDVAFEDKVPNFREQPYDLGSFLDIVHRQDSASESHGSHFTAEFGYDASREEYSAMSFRAVFEDHSGTPFPSMRTVSRNDLCYSMLRENGEQYVLRLATESGTWERRFKPLASGRMRDDAMLLPLIVTLMESSPSEDLSVSVPNNTQWTGKDSQPIEFDLDAARDLLWKLWRGRGMERPFASAPIRSRPRRTYDPIRLAQDPEGEYIPSYLASISRRKSDEWEGIRKELEKFGKESGLFDEISVKSFGDTDGDPFQIQVRKGSQRNLIDVGYGVSQALPMLTELYRAESPSMFLLQQPEVHLHPIAQASLGSLFCSVAAGGKQLLVETHSDYIIDRVRMDVRDGTTGLKPEDVSILYFEPGYSDVKIHNIRLDKMGNVLDAPHSYGEFFMAETHRLIVGP